MNRAKITPEQPEPVDTGSETLQQPLGAGGYRTLPAPNPDTGGE